MKKRKVANLIMVILILVIAAAGVLTAGFIRGWFDHDAQAATLREIRGVVTMQRGGVAYPVDSDTVLRKGGYHCHIFPRYRFHSDWGRA